VNHLVHRLRYRRFHGSSPEQMQTPMRIVSLWIVQSVMRASRFGAGISRRRDEEAGGQHVLEFPTRDGGGGADFGWAESLIHHIPAPEGDDLARLGKPIAHPLDSDVSPHHAPKRTLYIRDVQFGFFG